MGAARTTCFRVQPRCCELLPRSFSLAAQRRCTFLLCGGHVVRFPFGCLPSVGASFFFCRRTVVAPSDCVAIGWGPERQSSSRVTRRGDVQFPVGSRLTLFFQQRF